MAKEGAQIRGIVIGQGGTTELIVQATAEEVALFSKKDPIAFGKPTGKASVGGGMTLYDHAGRAVAIVTELTVSKPDLIDITSMGSASKSFLSGGLARIAIRAEGIGDLILQNF